jgi:bifunctional NMN adenylyltransferase/nudix hydrolase
VNELHDAHLDLINTVRSKHDRVIIFLGVSPLRNTLNNPMDFRARRTMLAEAFPDVEIHYVKDCRSNEGWSRNLDKQIAELLLPTQSCLLYGSRDSFINSYTGKYPTCELESTSFISGTEIRRRVINNYPPTKDYRAGLIAATASRFPTCYQTVDIAILDDKGNILLVRKPEETLFRFCGGFSDPKSESLEADAKREVLEETGVEVGALQYVGSMLVNDWRYRNEVDAIKTALFVAVYVYGKPEGADDVAEARWFKLNTLTSNDIIEEHRPLLKKLNEYLHK